MLTPCSMMPKAPRATETSLQLSMISSPHKRAVISISTELLEDSIVLPLMESVSSDLLLKPYSTDWRVPKRSKIPTSRAVIAGTGGILLEHFVRTQAERPVTMLVKPVTRIPYGKRPPGPRMVFISRPRRTEAVHQTTRRRAIRTLSLKRPLLEFFLVLGRRLEEVVEVLGAASGESSWPKQVVELCEDGTTDPVEEEIIFDSSAPVPVPCV
mmetsp:Transcript_70556/g.147771  ORF Transcript_70556/g.147771 Transcript_70556/m.147771 type:complete len:212 (+) Transcript_70556:1048-1683(+)